MATRREMLDGPRSTFQVGEALGKIFSIWVANLIPFAILSVIIFSPLYVWTFLTARRESLSQEDVSTWALLFSLGNLVLSPVLAGAVTFGVIQQLRGQRAGLGSCVSVGLSRLLPVLGVVLLSMLLVCLGVLAVFVGAVIVYVMLYVAVPVTVIERPGVVASLGRSKELTNGSKWPVFMVLLVLVLLGGALNLVLRKAFGEGTVQVGNRTYMWVSLLVGSLIQGPLSAIASTVIYHELRRSREGANIEDIAKVFD